MSAKKRTKATVKPATKTKKKPAGKQLTFQSGFWQEHWMPAAMILLIGMALYANTISFEYVLDDKIVLSENSFVAKGFAGIKEILTTESFAGYFGEQKDLVVGARYRPLSIVTFAIENQFFGQNTKVSHFINILLYGLTGLLIFRLFGVLTPIRKETPWWISIPFLVALFFIFHPVHSEVVANVKGRDEILCLMLALASVFYALKYSAKDKIHWLVISLVLFFLSLLAKENALTFIAIIPLTVYFFSETSLKKLSILTGTFLGVGILYLMIRTNVVGYFLNSGTEVKDIMNNPFYGLNVSEKFATIMYTLGLYLKLLIIPHPLTHDYYPFHIPVMSWGDPKVILALVANIALGIFALLNIRKKHIIAYGALFYFITLSIVSNIPFPVGTFMNERFIYMPSLGFCLIAAWLINTKIPEWVNDKVTNVISLGLFAILLIGFGIKTITRIPAWKDTYALNVAAIKVSKNSARANLFMGTAIYQNHLKDKDYSKNEASLRQAAIYINKALQINPRYGSAYSMKVGIAAELYKVDNDLQKLFTSFKEVLMIRPDIGFVEEYIVYLTGRTDAQVLANFCYDVGTSLISRGGRYESFGIKYLEKLGLGANNRDIKIRQYLAQYYQAKGNTAKAQQYSSQ